jgi:general secretion pathway protein L
MTGSTIAVRRGVDSFFDWWTGELRGLVPSALRFGSPRAQRAVAIVPDGEVVRLLRFDGAWAPLGGAIRLDDPGAKPRIARVVAEYGPGRWRYGLFLPEGAAAHALIRLPAAAADDLHETVGIQIGRLTPFERDAVYYDCRVADAAAGAAMALVEVAVATRAAVDDSVRRLQQIGLPVTFVTTQTELESGVPHMNLLPAPAAGGSALRRLNQGLALCAAILAGVAIYLPIHRDQDYIDRLTTQLDGLTVSARATARLEQEIAETRDRLAFISERRRSTPSLTVVLDDLTRLMPDDSWVQRLDYRQGKVRIVAQAPESAAIVRLVEQSEPFGGAQLEAAVRRDRAAGRDQFNLAFDVRAQVVR